VPAVDGVGRVELDTCCHRIRPHGTDPSGARFPEGTE
jgi:hypothetical protein